MGQEVLPRAGPAQPCHSSTLPGCTSQPKYKCSDLTNPAGLLRMLLKAARWAHSCPGTYSPPSLQREGQVWAAQSSQLLRRAPHAPASLRCAPSHKDLCQNEWGSLAACGTSHAGLKYSMHMVKSDQMQLFLPTSSTHAGRFGIQLF